MTEEQPIITEKKFEKFYNNNYKKLLIIPILILILSISYIGYFYSKTGDIMFKDSSLTGGTTITLIGDIDSDTIESSLKSQFSDLNLRKITDLRTGKAISTIIETSATREEIVPAIEKILGYQLTDKNSSIEFTGPSLSTSFYKQLMVALLISFVLMSIVIFILFRTFIPSIAVIFAALSDIIMPLAIIDYFNIRLSAAGIAAFLMLIGYAIDDNMLLTTRAIRKRGGTINSRLYGAFKVGIFMSLTALIAILPAFFIVSGLPDSFRQIFLILSLGLFTDIFNTWLTNAGIIKWYCEKRRLE